jgi:exonuclease III
VPKLISWNINEPGPARIEQQLNWIRSQRADVLALQEVGVGRAPELKKKLSELGFVHFRCSKTTTGRKKLVVIASRRPLRRIRPFNRLPHSEGAISCLISLGRKKAELHCVHVPNGSKYEYTKVRFLEEIVRGIRTRKWPHQLLAGDFNCPKVMGRRKVVTWEPTDKRWDDAERTILRPRSDMEGVYKFRRNGHAVDTYFKKARGGPNCFDHIIASKSIRPRVRVADKATKKLSDHAAVVAKW